MHKIVFWTVSMAILFVIFYGVTHLVVTAAMNDYQSERANNE